MSNPKLSILLASYGSQSQRFLDLCFRSLEAQSFKDFELIWVSSGEFKPTYPGEYVFRGTAHHSPERMHFPAAISKCYELSDPKSEYLLLLNDDALMAKTCIEKLYYVASRVSGLVNPRSNCDDNSRFYYTNSPFNKLQYKIDEMEQLADQAINFEDNYPFTIIKQPMIHFYCSMLSRKIWEATGGIDINLKTGFDDQDMCIRADKKGHPSLVAMHAYCLHASGATADEHLSQNDRNFNQEYFNQKHGILDSPK